MAEVLGSQPFEDDMTSALTDREGPKGRLLDCVVRWERGDFEGAAEIAPPAVVGARHLEALDWAERALDELLGDGGSAAAERAAA
jgi:hypothetical protein